MKTTKPPITLDDLSAQLTVIAKAVLTNKPMLDVAEASIYTGIAQSYLYKLTSTKQIPYYKPRGKMIYFDRTELDNWLRKNPVITTNEIDIESSNRYK